FTRTLGIAGVIPVLVIALLVGVPSSGGGISLYMVPDVFRDLNDVLPLPAAVDIVRATVYFDGTGIAGHLATIVGWGAVCLLLHIGIDWGIARHDRKRGTDSTDGGPDTDRGDGADSGPRTPVTGQEEEGPAPDSTGPSSSQASPRTIALHSRRTTRRRS
ncbi:hypothetical protein AB0E04_47425, partial [Streptomyces sp. NPDC048251]